MILGSLKRVGSDVNRYRTIAANVPYVPPPPQQRLFTGQMLPKLEPTIISAAQLALCAADETIAENPPTDTPPNKKKRVKPQDSMLWQVLTKHLLGISPLMAREAITVPQATRIHPLKVTWMSGKNLPGICAN